MENIINRYKKLMNELSLEYLANEADNLSVADMVKECKYQLDNHYENGNAIADMRYDEDPRVRKMWRSETEKLKRFINRYEVIQ
jgi:hypothetical protein